MERIQQVLAVVFAVLLVSASVTPALSLSPDTSTAYETPTATQPANTDTSDQTQASALELKHEAIEVLNNSTLSGPPDRSSERTQTSDTTTTTATATTTTTTATTTGTRQKSPGQGNGKDKNPDSKTTTDSDDNRGGGSGNGSEQVKQKRLETLNDTLSEFLDEDRIANESVFEADKQVAASVQSHAPNVTRLLADSDQRLAETALADARRVRETLRHRDVEYNDSAVSAEIENATEALDRADQIRSQDNPIGAMAQYREAWIHAQRALDLMDQVVEPRVTITTRDDPRHDSSIRYTVRGEIFDVRVHDLSNVILTVDGTRHNVSVSKPTKPGANATFETTVTLSDDPHTVVVSATDSGHNYGDTENDDPVVVQHGSDTLELDGDRLRDHFEDRRAYTNPLNPDSDSTATDANESANATPDDHEDLDSDDATNYQEQSAGSDPLDPDTDDDRLLDGFEIRYQNVSPIDADTDGNGTPDAQEDHEPDGLTNVREQNYSTHPNDPDTDDDELQDGPEIDEHGTEPLDPDTDGEGLKDGIEVHEYGTDPLNPDTDGEGLNDSEEIRKYGTDPLNPDTDSEGLNDSAEVHIYGTNPLDDDTDDDGLNDSEEIHRYGTDPLDSDTDSDGLEDGSEVNEYGTDPLDSDTDGEGLEDGPEVNEYDTDPLNPDTDGEGLTDAEEVEKYETDPSDPDTDDDRLTDAEELREYDTDPLAPDSDDDELDDGAEVLDYGTDPLVADTDDDGLEDGLEVHEYGTKPLVADTDGEGLQDGPEVNNYSTDPLDTDTDDDLLTDAEEVEEYGTDPLDPDTDGDAVGDGNETVVEMRPLNPDSDSDYTDRNEANDSVEDGDEDLDRDGATNSEEFDANIDPLDPDTDDDQLLDGFELWHDDLDPHLSDTDADGVLDADEDFESDGLVNLREQQHDTNPHDPDTDADDLADGTEVDTHGTDPTDPDTDADNLTDGAEVHEYGTEPLDADTDGDGLTDGAEVHEYSTDPLDPDTDDDGLTDAAEVHRYQTSPLDPDSDDDGLEDGPEINEYDTKPLDPDTDADNLTDGPEVHEYGTKPLVKDTDTDNITDGPEVHEYGTVPTEADTDTDNLTDGQEVFKYETDPLDNDTDDDGLEDGPEISNETDPFDPDTDSDGLEDGPEVNEYESDPLNRDTDNETIWDGPEANEYGTDPTKADTDDDLLNDSTELNRSKTDPTVADSDSARTEIDDSGNNVTDGNEDFDADGIATYYEYALATDPFTNDTDGDGLFDGYEAQFGLLDPRTAHSDNDSVPDGREDFDGDNLSTAREQELGTHLNDSDTDGEGLSDAAEIRRHGTDPLAVDTDDDDLNDSEELDLPTDPTVADTDGDGTIDGNETFTTEKTDNETGVTVNVTGKGNVASTVSVNNSSKTILQTDTVENVSASNVYEFEAKDNFTTANITLPYNESKVPDANESALGAYRYNETLQTFVPINNSTVDSTNNTVTAETPHFSTYTVLSSENWESRFNESLPSKWSNTDNFSDLDDWERDGDVSSQFEMSDAVGSFAVRESDSDTERNATIVVGNLTRPNERNWTKPTANNSTNESDENATAQSPPPKHDDGGGTCDGSCETTETTTEEITTEDTKEDSDNDGTYDRYDDCPGDPGEGSDGCPVHSDDDGIKDYNDNCDTREGEGDGCPSDSDDDGTRDFYDDCPNTKGEGDDGCAINTDGDDYQNYFDDCPDEPGEGSDGCPIDDDGDDTRNYYDECPEFPGWKDNGCPRTSSLEQNVTLRDAKTITVGTIAKANAVSNRSVAKLVVIGPDGEQVEVYGEENTNTGSSTQSVREAQLGALDVLPGGEGDAPGDFEAVEQDISQFAGEQVTIKIVTVGRATFEINALKIGFDTDGDGLYDAVERGSCGLRDGTGQCLDTDPYLADTDGDGLSDSYEIKERRKVHGHVYQELRSNPTVRDTDRDGLDDEQEVRGSFRFAVTRSAEASLGYLNGQTPEDKREHLTTTLTDSNPLKADTDDDGLNDREEWLYKTDPRNPDSDGDSLIDGKERPIGADPTLHDYRGPDIRLVKHGVRFRENGTKIQFVLVYYAVDPSTVAKTTVTKNEDVRYTSRPSTFISRHNGSFTDEYFGEGISGTKVEISATDRHGNRKTAAGIRRANDCGQKAKRWSGTDTLDSSMFARGYAACSGFQASIGSTIQEILRFVDDPLGFFDGLVELIGLLDETGLLDMFIDAVASSLQDKQKTNNPYSKGDPHYDEYKRAWYGGYAAGFIAKTIYGASAAKVLKGSDYIQGISKYAKSTRAGQAGMRVKAPYDRGKARVATGLARGTKKAADPVLRQAKSAGATYRLWQLQRKGDVDTSDLSEAERRRVADYLARHGEDGATTLRWMDDDDFDALFRKACDGGVRTSERAGGGCTGLTDYQQHRYSDAVTAADVDESAFAARLDNTDISNANARRVFSRTGRYGVEMANEIDNKALNRFVQLDPGSQRALVNAWRAEGTDIDSRDIERVLDKHEWASQTGVGTKFRSVLRIAGVSGVRFVDDTSKASLRKILDSDLSPDSIAASVRKYDRLNPEYESKFIDVLSETDADVSWMRTVSRSEIGTGDVEKALDRVDSIDRHGHETEKFLSAKKANKQYTKKHNNRPPHEEGTIVIDFKIESKDKFWRVHDKSDDPASRWIVRPKAVKNADSKEELIDSLGLLPKEWGIDYNYVSKLKISNEDDITIRMSTVGDVRSKDTGEYRSGGATQYMLKGSKKHLKKEVGDQWVLHNPLDHYIDLD